PHLSPAEEESLLAGEAVEHHVGLPLLQQQVSLVRHLQSTVVADVLSELELAVELYSRQRLVRGILIGERVDELLERSDVALVPPRPQNATGVGLGPLVVEPMPHLV